MTFFDKIDWGHKKTTSDSIAVRERAMKLPATQPNIFRHHINSRIKERTFYILHLSCSFILKKKIINERRS